ncbi:hypothetical protein CPB85DRAFT_421177 [Mucidula mucida]|nr:hypothetical protein CPB85DRAFT_421177 [Mucidula mucida]
MRLPFNRIIRKVTKYRLGYNVQRDYPGHWTTPVVLFVYMALATFLALMNIPLTAYDTVQEYTYTPNATILPLPFSYLVPTFLRSRLPDFSPRTLRVGDILYLNESIEEYNVTSADVDSFLFYNNPLTSCDVQDMTMQIYTNTIGIPPMRISVRTLPLSTGAYPAHDVSLNVAGSYILLVPCSAQVTVGVYLSSFLCF